MFLVGFCTKVKTKFYTLSDVLRGLDDRFECF